MFKQPTPPRRVLVAEHDDQVRAYAAAVLRSAGYLVTEARTGADALWRAGDRPSHLLLTDLRLPDTTGRRLASVLRGRCRMPAAFMSGHPRDDAEDYGLLPAGAAFVAKPFLPSELERAVGEAMAAGAGY